MTEKSANIRQQSWLKLFIVFVAAAVVSFLMGVGFRKAGDQWKDRIAKAIVVREKPALRPKISSKLTMPWSIKPPDPIDKFGNTFSASQSAKTPDQQGNGMENTMISRLRDVNPPDVLQAVADPAQNLAADSVKTPESLRALDAQGQKDFYKRVERERKQYLAHGHSIHAYIQAVIPQLRCPYKIRVGSPGDGGKWVCHPLRARPNCVIYSLGVGAETSFERAILKLLPTCKTFSFDPNPSFGNLFKGVGPQMTFYPWKIDTKTNLAGASRSLDWITKHFGHTQIDFLKVDIEGAEFEALPAITQEDSGVKICQILVEIHSQRQKKSKLHALLSLLENRGYFMITKEIFFCGFPCAEYSFVQESCFSDYGLSKDDVLFKMFT